MDWWQAVLPVVGSVAGGLLASDAADDAAAAQTGAIGDATRLQANIFEQQRADLAPWRAAGERGLQRFEQALGPGFAESPGYRFALDQGIRTIDRAAAARGMLGSGARLQALTRYGQGVANQEYGAYLNRLATLAGLGQTATAQGNAAAQQFGTNAGNLMVQGGDARAAAAINNANAWAGALNNLSAWAYGTPGAWGR